MRTLYFDCSMGAAGDMLAAALLELHPYPSSFVEKLNGLGIPAVVYHAETAIRCGITGTHMSVSVNGVEEGVHHHNHHHEHDHENIHEHGHMHDEHGHTHEHEHTHKHIHEHSHDHHSHSHSSLHDIIHIVEHLDLPSKVSDDIISVYNLIADAESKVHGKTVEEIHFHEVGTLDAVADVVAVCLLIHELSLEKIISSPINVGSGHVHCAHGILPVPAPATALLLQGVPTYGGQIQSELCTPTGAALLKFFVQEYGAQPPMCVSKIGYGCGTKEFPQANCVRAMLGEMPNHQEQIIQLSCNVDDMTPEAVGFAMEELLNAGALDVYTIPIGMKKNRPGVLFTCMCNANQKDEMLKLIFRHTTTLGIRENICSRYTLARRVDTINTPYGSVRIKKASGWGVSREKFEYDDISQIARNESISLQEVEKKISK